MGRIRFGITALTLALGACTGGGDGQVRTESAHTAPVAEADGMATGETSAACEHTSDCDGGICAQLGGEQVKGRFCVSSYGAACEMLGCAETTHCFAGESDPLAVWCAPNKE